MGLTLNDMRAVHVVGIGLHRYQFESATSYVDLGLTAVRGALVDAGLAWPDVESAFVAKALLPMAPGRPMLRHLGATGLPIVHIENASASGSSAFRHAVWEVASGATDVSLVVGVDKPRPLQGSEPLTGITGLADDAIKMFTQFALLADLFAQRTGATAEDIALVAVKNHRNGARNPFAQHQKVRTLEQVMGGKPIAGSFTSLQCTPVGEGAAAVLIASEDAIRRLNLDRGRAVRVAASATRSQRLYDDPIRYDAMLTAETAVLALHEAGRTPADLDVVEVHDAFAVEELEYVEAIGLCPHRGAVARLRAGEFDIGGSTAISPSGGLIAMGHPIGPTGVGQIVEIARQLRGEADDRQQPAAKTGLAHMVGLGSVCYVHVLTA